MSVFNIFSKRQKQLRGEVPDVYQYTHIPQGLRVQIVHAITDIFNDSTMWNESVSSWAARMHDALCREYGVFKLSERDYNSKLEGFLNFILGEKDIERVLDAVELALQVIDGIVRQHWYMLVGSAKSEPDAVIDELNRRFRENGVGFQYESGEIIRVDSQLVHSEVVKPTLLLLQGEEYKGANEEFLKAHAHYRHQRYKECLVDCLKAFESVIKVICVRRKWSFNSTDSASALVKVLFDNGLVPTYMMNQFSGLRSILESVGTPRNKTSGHGQGAQPIVVDSSMASYALHMTASTILFLSELDKSIP